MALTRWEPFREIESMQRQMNRLFDQMMSYGGSQIEGDRMDGMTFMPAVEVHETDNKVKLRLEVPGVEAKDLDVNVSAEAVAIRGERRSEVNQENGGMRRSEFQNGVLCLTLPKAENEKNRIVKVNLQGQNQQSQIQPEQSSNQSQSSNQA